MKHFKSCGYIILICILFPVLGSSEEQPFRFAWLSDTHVGASGGTLNLRRAVQDINRLDSICFVLLSGDVTELEVGDYLETAKQILDSLTVPYHIIPGNHDTKWSASGCTEFKQLFGADKFRFTYSGILFIGLHQGPLMRMGPGFVAPEDLRWIESQLAHLDNPQQPIILVTHYPLDTSVGNWFKLINILREYNPQVILHGHGHANRTACFGGIPGVMGRSTLSRGEESSGYNLVDVSNDRIEFRERLTGQKTKEPWYQLRLEERNYNDENDPQAPEFSAVNDQYPGVACRWQADTRFAIAAAPVIGNNRVYIGNTNGQLMALSIENGDTQWKFQSDAGIYTSATVQNQRVVFSSADSNIYCLAEKTGKLLWKVKTGAPVVASPLIKDDRVFCGGSDGIFRVLDLQTGAPIWQYQGVQGFVETRPLIYRDKVIFGAWNGCLYALRKHNGELCWKWNDGRQGVLYSPAVCQPVAAEDRVYIVAPDRCMSCIDLDNGNTLWRSCQDKVRESIGMSTDRTLVFARCMWDTVFAIEADQREFEYEWKQSMEYGFDIDPSFPIEKEGVIFFGTGHGEVYALKAQTGQLIWKHRISYGLVNTACPLSAQAVVVSAMDGKVSLLEYQSP